MVDTSQGRDEFVREAESLVKQLADESKAEDSNIKVGVVQFHGYAKRQLELTELTSSNVEKVKDSISAAPKIGSGSNLPAGLAEAEKMLNADSAVKNSRKYVVTISDCKTYLYMKTKSGAWSSQTEPSDYDTSSGFSRAISSTIAGSLYEWADKYKPKNNDDPDKWELPADIAFYKYITALKNNEGAYKFDDYDFDYIYYREHMSSGISLCMNNNNIINMDKSMTQTLALLQNMSDKGMHYYFYHPVSTSSPLSFFGQFINY